MYVRFLFPKSSSPTNHLPLYTFSVSITLGVPVRALVHLN